MITPAGKTRPSTPINFTDVIFATIRLVIKMATTTTNHEE
jgi:hypothetical protein